jgi:hypothetical protein
LRLARRVHVDGQRLGIEIIEERHLKVPLEEYLDLDVLISLPKLPPGWNRSDLR